MKGKWVAWLALLGAVVLCCAMAWAGETEEAGENSKGRKPWQGRLADGRVIGEKELTEILSLHKRGLGTVGKRENWAYMLWRADLSNVSLEGADLSELDLGGANLTGANLTGAKLRKAILTNAILTKANLTGSDLSQAVLYRADLGEAKLGNAKLGETQFTGANLREAFFQPDFHTITQDDSNNSRELSPWPDLGGVEDSIGLYLVAYDNPHPMATLRERLKNNCFLTSSRQLTHALRHNKKSVGLDSHIAYYLIAWPTNWGLSPLLPIWYMFLLIIPFAVIYWLALHRADTEGIWRIWDPNSLRRPPQQPWKQLLKSKDGANPLYALYFSLLSAFHIGWRDFNVGNWISRMQPREYTLRATGWARVASGLQSLISVYLLALALLTYFGRPFE
ncbi:MAG: pentapeptide repeat-containing protein [Desulfarculus sp.]|nr:pentapeptide repeat-containing protein [Desulfarculus sp.]